MASDMLVIVKSREVQRAMLAEMRGDRQEAARRKRRGKRGICVFSAAPVSPCQR
jgi:hypothetical protein